MALRLVVDRAADARVADRREVILAAARTLFLANGYAATSIADIAQLAGATTAEVKSHFGTRGQLLVQLRAAWLRDTDYDHEVARMSREPDAVRRLRLMAAMARRSFEDDGGMLTVVDDAIRADANLDRLWAAVELFTDDDVLAFVEGFGTRLDPALSVRAAADIIWALCGIGVYRELVLRRHWSPDRYEEWLVHSLQQQLLAQPARESAQPDQVVPAREKQSDARPAVS